MKTAKEYLADLIAIRTDGSRDGVMRCVDYISEVLLAHNVCFERVKHALNGKESLIAVVNAPELKDIFGGLVFSGHIDTVSANEAEWNVSPFELTDIAGKLYGRGTVDMKYFAAVLLSKLEMFKSASFPVFLVFTSDEETDVCGAREVVSFLRERRIFPKYALIGEPTDFKLCVANKGYAGYRTIVKGVAGHSSAPDLGVNALYVAAKIIQEIERLNAVYMPFGTTLNVGVIKGGKERNSIADEAVIDWEIRYICEEHKEAILQAFSSFEANLLGAYQGARVECLQQETLPAFVEQEGGRLTEKVCGLLHTERLALKYATEAGFFQKAGMETLVCGAGDEKLAHTSGEYILAEDLERYCRFLEEFVAAMR